VMKIHRLVDPHDAVTNQWKNSCLAAAPSSLRAALRLTLGSKPIQPGLITRYVHGLWAVGTFS